METDRVSRYWSLTRLWCVLSGAAICFGPVAAETKVDPRVVIDTPYGSIVAVVYLARAPVTAGNFLRYVDQGIYKKAEFYRALRPDNGTHLPTLRLIQGGVDPTCLHPPM